MKRVANKVCLIAAWAVFFGVIWQVGALAAAPAIESLGQIKDDLVVSSRIDVDVAGNAYIVDPRRSHVVKYDQYSKRVATYDQVTPDGRGLAVSPDGGTLYVSSNNRVEILNTATGAVSYLGGEALSFVRIADIDIDARGVIFIADAGDYAIKVFAPNGVMIYRFGSKGDAPGQFQGINGLTVDSVTGRVYVTDSVYTNASAPEVLVFSLNGALLTSFPGETGFGTAKLSFFSGITFDALGRLYVFDGFKSYMYAYELAGNTLVNQYTYSQVGFTEGKLSGPQDAVYDSATGRLFVACSNGRVEIFGVDGATNPVKVNVAPGVPNPVSPVADSMVTSSGPSLRFENAVDVDAADVLTYDLEVFAAADLTTPVASLTGVDEGDAFTEVVLSSTGIAENNRHAWRVRAYDGTDYSPWSDVKYFWVNAVDEAPSMPVAVAPLVVDTILDGSGVISWSAATDPDPQSVISYEIEIATDENFENVHAAEILTGESVTLGGLQDYPQLVVGSGYFWRVVAVDEGGLRSGSSLPGAFLYNTSVLYVKSPMPGTRVYLGGDRAYPGQLLGEAPLELRDFPVGKTSVTAERAGFEPFVAPVEMAVRSTVVVDVDLVAAIAPEDFKSRPVEAAGQKIFLTTGAAPVLADVNADGVSDLLVVDAAGNASLYVADAGGYLAGEDLLLASPIAGAAPFVVDWNNDGRLDLLVGGADSLSVYDALSGEPVVVQDVTTLLATENDFTPIVAELNDDNAKDLLVGTSSGQVYRLLNDGDDAAPTFSSRQPVLKSALEGAVAPLWVDWDADGQRDLLVAAQGAVYLCAADSDGYYAPVQMISAGNLAARKSGGKGKVSSANNGLALGGQLRVVADDIDGVNGKDLLVGNAAGELVAVVSHGDQVVAAYREALLEKVAALEAAGVDMSEVRSSLDAEKYGQAMDLIEALLLDDTLASDVESMLNDLLQLLG